MWADIEYFVTIYITGMHGNGYFDRGVHLALQHLSST